MDHPHLHTLVPAGGWNEMAQCWKSSGKKFFIPVKVISVVFKGKFLSLLKAAYNEKKLIFPGETKPPGQTNNFRRLLDAVYGKDWVVFAKKPFKNPSHIIKYLGRYTRKVAISNERIVGTEGNEVIFRWKDYRNRGERKTMRLAGSEFIRRFLLHVLPKGFCKIRYYGIFASRTRKPIIETCRNVLGKVDAKSKFEGLAWQEALLLATRIDVTACPVCKTGKMTMAFSFNSHRAPPST